MLNKPAVASTAVGEISAVCALCSLIGEMAEGGGLSVPNGFLMECRRSRDIYICRKGGVANMPFGGVGLAEAQSTSGGHCASAQRPKDNCLHDLHQCIQYILCMCKIYA